MARGASWATVHKVAKSWTQMSVHIPTHTPFGESGSFSIGLVEMECVLSHFIKVILLGETWRGLTKAGSS